MKEIKNFLELSTIHGLYYISSTRKLARFAWILVVITGFCEAAYLIRESFNNWSDNPIKTTIETQDVSQITFPNVSVCPPRGSLTNLNYDIIHSQDKKLDEDTRTKLFENALDIIQNVYFAELMSNLSKVLETNRYYNWYYGFTTTIFNLDENSNQCKFLLMTDI